MAYANKFLFPTLFFAHPLSNRLDRQDRELELMSLAMKELAEELNKLALALQP